MLEAWLIWVYRRYEGPRVGDTQSSIAAGGGRLAREVAANRTSAPRPTADNRNSARSVHRTFCLDCCVVVEELPQKLFKEQKGLDEQAQQSPLKVQNLTRRQLEEYTVAEFEAGDVVKRFFRRMDKFLLKVDQVTSTESSSFS